MKKELKQNSFIQRASAIHNNKYDYSQSIYTSSEHKIIIGCPIHGMFTQKTNAHLYGKGCDKCRIEELRKSQDKYINQCISFHGDTYDFSKTIYLRNTDKVIATCKTHGDFSILPYQLLLRGCAKCAEENERKLLENNFLLQSAIIHNNKYDYSLVSYINSSTGVDIICPIHGKFTMSPSNHMSIKRGCTKCIKELRQKVSTDIFIKKANKVHNNKYDYSKTICYTRDTVTITCLIHGDFKQNQYDHLCGCDCPKCANSGISNPEIEWLDSLNILEDNRQFTIKYTYFDFDSQKVKNKSYSFDGYDPITNTIYEYHGSYFHGDPLYFKPWDINKKTHSSFGELYNNTLIKRNFALALGYTIVENWDGERIEVYSPNNITSPICSDLLQL